jgi:translation initiation factor eIF-2B subunit gamma
LITPPTSNAALSAALAQNPYLTSLPSPSATLLSPSELDHTTPTAALLRLSEIQNVIKSDFLLLPCDLICDVPGEIFLETYLTTLGGLGGAGSFADSDYNISEAKLVGLNGERSGRRGGLSIWYNTANREESVKGEECDFLCTARLDYEHEISEARSVSDSDDSRGTIRKLVWAMPISELLDKCEEDKSWRIRQSLLQRYGAVKCLTKFRDSHIYLFPHWVKDFARLNEDFESVSEDLVGTWAKAEWRKPSYGAKFGLQKIFGKGPKDNAKASGNTEEIPIEEEVDFLSLSSTRTTTHNSLTISAEKPAAQLASRVQADPEDSILSPSSRDSDIDTSNLPIPNIPPILAYLHPATPAASLIRRVDTTPILLSVSLLLANVPSLDECPGGKHSPSTSPFAHQSKVASTATIAPQVTITRADTLIGSNTSIASKCVIKSSIIGSNVTIGAGTRVTGCLIMDGVTIGEKCVLTGTVIGKKVTLGKNVQLTGCEVQDGNMLGDGTEGKKGEKFLVGGLEDEIEGEGFGDGEELDDNEF